MRTVVTLVLVVFAGHGVFAQDAKRIIVNPEGAAEFTEKKGIHDVRLILASRIFNQSRHRIGRARGCVTIDGRAPLGTDCGLPKVEIASMRLFLDGKRIPIPRGLYSDCYSPPFFKDYQARGIMNKYLAIKFGDDMSSVFVFLAAGDGAGVYDVIWVLRKDGNHTRFTNSGEDCGFLNFNCKPN
jgi:hypothetical protein